MTNKHNMYAVSAVIAVILLLLAMGSWYVIDQGERGVEVRFGEVKTVSEPGLHFKVPLMDSVRKISVQEHLVTYRDMAAYSSDQQPAGMKVSVRYQIDAGRLPEIYSEFGSIEALLSRQVTPEVLKNTKVVFGQFNATRSIRERGVLNNEVLEAVRNGVSGPIHILGVQIEDVKFSKTYETSVEQRMLAEVAVERENQNLEREKIEANIARERAKAKADAVRYNAEAEAEAIRLRGDAEASAITARAEALGENPNLVELVKAENWNGILPTTMLPNSTVPFIEANKVQ